MALALVGVVYRRRASRVWSWTLYLSFLFTLQVLTTARPDIFFTWHVWVAKESVAALLAVAILLEITAVSLAAAPAGHRSTTVLLAAVIWATLLFVVTTPGQQWPNKWDNFLGLVALPRLNVGIALAYCSVMGAVLFYGVPLRHFEKSLLFGLSAYLLVYVMTLDQLNLFFAQIPWVKTTPWGGSLDASVYTAVLAVWVREAWRRTDPEVRLPGLTWIQPA